MTNRNYSITKMIVFILALTVTMSLGAQDSLPLPQSSDGTMSTRAAVYNEIITNGGAESGFTAWNTLQTRGNINVACDNAGAGQFYAATGSCAFVLANNTNSKKVSVIKQVIRPRQSIDAFRAGHVLDLNVFANSNNLYNAKGVAVQVQIIAKFKDGTKQKANVKLGNGETSYQAYNKSMVLKRKAKKIIVKVKYLKGTTGSAFIDGISIAHIASPTCVVDQQDEKSWSYFIENSGSGLFMAGRGPLPSSQGSFMMATGSGNGQNLGGRVYMTTNSLDGVRLDQINSITYNTYIEASPNSGSVLPVVNLYVDLDGDGFWNNNDPLSSVLVFNPAHNAQNAIMTRDAVWTTWRLDRSTTRWSDLNGIVSNPSNPQVTLNAILQYYPNAKIVSPYPLIAPRFKGFQLVAGSSDGGAWTNFIGYVDNVQFNTAASVRCQTTDFEAYSPLN